MAHGNRSGSCKPCSVDRPIEAHRDHPRSVRCPMKRKCARKAPGDQRVEPIRPLSCHTCGRAIAGFESVHYGSVESGYRDLCNRCFNEEVARTGEIDFAHVQFEPLEIPDAAGVHIVFTSRCDFSATRWLWKASNSWTALPEAISFRC